MKAYLMVGSNWTMDLMEGLIALTAKYPDTPIKEVYGSIPSYNPIGTARPDFRLNDMSYDRLILMSRLIAGSGIKTNYTLNVSMIDPRELKLHEVEIIQFLESLSLVADRVTIAHPLVGELVQKYCDIPIELSTILQVNSVRQLEMWKERLPHIDKVCVDVFRNRDWKWLKEFRKGCDRLAIEPELLVNEFCIHQCIDRNQCYDLHSLNMTKEEVMKSYGNYPMGRCIAKRHNSRDEWLRARYILPQWMHLYMDMGYNHFKISGRTHPTDFILRVTEYYQKRMFKGNLLSLWGHLETIFRDGFLPTKEFLIDKNTPLPQGEDQ